MTVTDSNLGFGRWFFSPRRLLNGLISACLLGAWFYFFAKQRPDMRSGLLYFLKEPFFDLSWIILIGSNVDLDYMEFKLEQRAPPAPPVPGPWVGQAFNRFKARLGRQRIVPERYIEAFGEDLYTRIWKFRFAFMLSFFVGMIHLTFFDWKSQ